MVTHGQAEIALIFDYDADIGWDIQPHGSNLTYFNLIFEIYVAFRKLGQTIDILSPFTEDFSNYKIVFVPGLLYMSETLKQTLSNFNGLKS